MPEGFADSLRLRNGKQVHARTAIANLKSLMILLSREPSLFQALLTVAEGRHYDPAPSQIDALLNAGFIRPDRTVNADIRDILLSAHQLENHESKLVNPFSLDSPDEKATLARVAGSDHAWVDLLHQPTSYRSRR